MRERFESFNNLGFLDFLPILNERLPITAVFAFIVIVGVLIMVTSFIHFIHFYIIIPFIRYIKDRTILSSIPITFRSIDIDVSSPLTRSKYIIIIAIGLFLSISGYFGVVQIESDDIINERKELRDYTLGQVYKQNISKSLGENDVVLSSLTSKGVTNLTFEHNGALYENKRILIYVDSSATELGLVPFSLDGSPSYIEDFANDLTANGYSVYTELGSARGITTLGRLDYLYVINSLN